MRLKILLCLLCLSFVVLGCERLPEIRFPAITTPTTGVTLSPQPSETPKPTVTLPEGPGPTLTVTPRDIPFNRTPTQPTPAALRYTLQPGGPFYLPNFTHPEAGCDWMGVAGQIFDQEGIEVLGIMIISGSLSAPEENLRDALTGLSTAYGLGGYEIQVAGSPINSTGTFWVQVVDGNGQPLSEQIFFDTFQDCERNLVLLNFIPLVDPAAP